MLDFRHLKTLKALRDTGSLVGAAQQVFLTQSALSHQLKELETHLETPLFMRKSRPLRFTPAGKRLLHLADEVLGQVADAERDLKKLIHGEAGRLFMAIECHSCFNWLMPSIEQFRQQWPLVELDFSGGFTFDPLPALITDEVDLVITSDPQKLKGVNYQPLFTYEMQIALAKNHSLAHKGNLKPEDLASETLITYPVERERLDIFKRFLDPAGIAPAAIRNTELTLMMIQLVASGRGVCALPNWVLGEYTQTSMITVKSAGQSGIWPTLYAAVREDAVNLPYLQDFLLQAKNHCFKHLSGITTP